MIQTWIPLGSSGWHAAPLRRRVSDRKDYHDDRQAPLARFCQKTLDEAEQRVQILSAKSVEAELEPFADHD